MQTKTFIAKDMRQAMRDISQDLGPDAVILSNSRVPNGIEVIATAEYQEEVYKQQFSRPDDPYNHANMNANPAKPKSDTSVKVTLPTESESQASQDLMPDTVSISKQAYAPVQVPEIPTSQLQDIREELSGLRNLVKEQLLGLTRDDMQRRYPVRMKIHRRLLDMGLSQSLARDISGRLPEDLGLNDAWEKALSLLMKKVPVNHKLLESNRIITLVGPTGVGKTTTIAKLAARYVLEHGRNKIALITTDSYRIGAHEQLRTYARILDIPLYTVTSEKELDDTLAMVKRKGLVLVDTAGMGHRDERLESQFRLLDRIKVKKSSTVLVLSAATQYEAQAETIRTFGNRINACILSKLDEAANIGAVLSNVIESGIDITFTSDGQRVPEDIQEVDLRDIMDRSVSLVREMDSAEDSFEHLLWGRSVNANV